MSVSVMTYELRAMTAYRLGNRRLGFQSGAPQFLGLFYYLSDRCRRVERIARIGRTRCIKLVGLTAGLH